MIMKILSALLLIFLNCAYVPKYVNIGEANCNQNDKSKILKKYYPDKTIQIEAYYSNGAMDSFVTYFPKGIRSSVTRFRNGLYEDYSNDFYANGTIKSSVLFRNGVEVYRSRLDYDSLGNNLFEWIDKSDKTSMYKSHYPTGEKKFEFEYR
jgi:antitoxin component YwqK of YwqJK toxin-antitoxin module